MSAPLKTQAPPQTINVEFIKPFLAATMHVLQLQASTTAKHGVAFRKERGAKILGDISGTIGLVADAFNGTVMISFPEATFLKIMSRMLGEEFTTMSPDIQDGAGELTNIIFGSAKVVLNKNGFNIQTALPSVIIGRDHVVLTPTSGPSVVIPFSSDAGEFFIEICLSA